MTTTNAGKATMLKLTEYSNAAAPQALTRKQGTTVFFFIPLAGFWLTNILGASLVGSTGRALFLFSCAYAIYTTLAIAYDWIQTRRAAASVWTRRAFLTRDVAQTYGVALSEVEESKLMQVINGTAKAKMGAATEFAIRGDVRYLARAEDDELAIYRDAAGVLARL